MELVASLVSLLGPGRHVMIPPSSVFSNKNDFSILAFAFSDMFLLSFVKGVQRAGQYIYSCVGVTFTFGHWKTFLNGFLINQLKCKEFDNFNSVVISKNGVQLFCFYVLHSSVQ